MKIEITPQELIMMEAFKKMRKAAYSEAQPIAKKAACNEIWIRANQMLDLNEGR